MEQKTLNPNQQYNISGETIINTIVFLGNMPYVQVRQLAAMWENEIDKIFAEKPNAEKEQE